MERYHENDKLNELFLGRKILTSTSMQEMELINLIVDNDLNNDIVKKAISNGIFIWHLRSRLEAIEEAVTFFEGKNVIVLSSKIHSIHTNYYCNNQFYVLKKDYIDCKCGVVFKESKLRTLHGDEIVLNILPKF